MSNPSNRHKLSYVERPKASYVDFLHLGENLLRNKKIVGELKNLREQHLVGTQVMINQLDNIAHAAEVWARESHALLEETNRLQEESLQSLRGIEHGLENLARQTNQIMSDTSAIVHHLDQQAKKQEEDEGRRLLIHKLNVHLELIESRKNQYPEWGLLEINILEDMISSNDISIEQFASSLEELKQAQVIFDKLKVLRIEINEILGD